ncbi:hypothetical protein [Sanguibacter suarezii]|uniref:hypothetical protein n=1 Tax=Sanguibacter suarezii TaxID=60921 RepID=UPI00083485F8|nr:hypothetical protein [Sanguibacter suarezii]
MVLPLLRGRRSDGCSPSGRREHLVVGGAGTHDDVADRTALWRATACLGAIDHLEGNLLTIGSLQAGCFQIGCFQASRFQASHPEGDHVSAVHHAAFSHAAFSHAAFSHAAFSHAAFSHAANHHATSNYPTRRAPARGVPADVARPTQRAGQGSRRPHPARA